MENMLGFMNSGFYTAMQYLSILLNFVLIVALIVLIIVGIRFVLILSAALKKYTQTQKLPPDTSSEDNTPE